MLACRNDMPLLMGRHSTSKIVRRAVLDVAIAQVRGSRRATRGDSLLRSCGASGDTLGSAGLSGGQLPEAGHAKDGGAGGIRTLDRALQPYNGLANRRLQPLGHSSVMADMPDTGASRKRQIRITSGPFSGGAR
jgi:hypothetical protein